MGNANYRLLYLGHLSDEQLTSRGIIASTEIWYDPVKNLSVVWVDSNYESVFGWFNEVDTKLLWYETADWWTSPKLYPMGFRFF